MFCQFTIVNMMDFRMEERLCDELQIHSSRFDSVSWPGGFLWIQRQKKFEFFVPESRSPLKTLEKIGGK